MKLSFLFLLQLAFSLSAQASIYEDAVYKGAPDSADGHLWKSTVGLHFDDERGGRGICTGVFIERDLILTAAHCLIKQSGGLNIALYSKNDPRPVRIMLGESDFIMRRHPGFRFKGDKRSDDIAFILLRSDTLPSDYGFETAKIYRSGDKEAQDSEKNVTAAGLGGDHLGQNGTQVTYVQGTITRDHGSGILEIQFPNDQGICNGDSGGPVFLRIGSGVYLTALSTAGYRKSKLDEKNRCSAALLANSITPDRLAWVNRMADEDRRSFKKNN